MNQEKERAILPKSPFFDIESLTPEQLAYREEHITRMLEDIDAVLLLQTDTTRSIFILFYGLNGDHGKWHVHRIADHFALTVEDVLKTVAEIGALLSDSHLRFARTYTSAYC